MFQQKGQKVGSGYEKGKKAVVNIAGWSHGFTRPERNGQGQNSLRCPSVLQNAMWGQQVAAGEPIST